MLTRVAARRLRRRDEEGRDTAQRWGNSMCGRGLKVQYVFIAWDSHAGPKDSRWLCIYIKGYFHFCERRYQVLFALLSLQPIYIESLFLLITLKKKYRNEKYYMMYFLLRQHNVHS